MKNTQRLNKSELQQQMRKRAQLDTALTNNWLKNGGMTVDDLLYSESLLLQAQKVAHELLQHHIKLIKHQKIEWLKDFAKRSKQSRQRLRITDKECYAVLNYSKSINRQLFNQYRKIKD